MRTCGVQVKEERAEVAPELSTVEARDVVWTLESGDCRKKKVSFSEVVWYKPITAVGKQRPTRMFTRTSRTGMMRMTSGISEGELHYMKLEEQRQSRKDDTCLMSSLMFSEIAVQIVQNKHGLI